MLDKLVSGPNAIPTVSSRFEVLVVDLARRRPAAARQLAEALWVVEAGLLEVLKLRVSAKTMGLQIGLRVRQHVRVLFVVSLQMRVAASVFLPYPLVVVGHYEGLRCHS
jgi:hypothetical protein